MNLNLLEFSSNYLKLSKNYSEDRIMFVDGFDINLTSLDRTLNVKKKKDGKATIMLPITANGNLLRPLLIMNNSGTINIKPTQYIRTSHNEFASIELQELIKVIKDNINNSEDNNLQDKDSWLIIIPTYSFLEDCDIIKNACLENVEFVLLPKGVSCIANPLKEVLPVFFDCIGKFAQREVCVEDLLVTWIERTLNTLTIHYSHILESAFDCLKLSL